MLTLETTAGGFFEAFSGATYSFNLWHYYFHFALLNNESDKANKTALRKGSAESVT
ncbi:hypothetical protein DDI_2121 [Dickeya dianthicola RNS04.9]|nr:hypothetical protein DDI_2121 [Dickeya dianthicola RNS04.9]